MRLKLNPPLKLAGLLVCCLIRSSAILAMGPLQTGSAFDSDRNEGLSRTCVSLSMTDGSEPYAFFRPNISDAQVVYDQTAEKLLDHLGLAVDASLTFGTVKAEGHFGYVTAMGKDEMSESVTIVQTARNGLLQVKPDALVRLNALGQKALLLPPNQARELCGQGYVSSQQLSRGYIATLKISYNKKEDLVDVDGSLKIDLKRISVGGQFHYNLRERAARGEVSLDIQAWGGDVSQLTRGITDDLLLCNRKQWKLQPKDNKRVDIMKDPTAACVRSLAALLDNGRAFVGAPLPEGKAWDQAQVFRTDRVQAAPYKFLFIDGSRTWPTLEKSATDRASIANSLTRLGRDQLSLGVELQHARRVLDAGVYIPSDQKAKLREHQKKLQGLMQEIDAAAGLCRKDTTAADICAARQQTLQTRVANTLDRIPAELYQLDHENFAGWCERLRGEELDFKAGQPRALRNSIRQTLIALIEDSNLSGTREPFAQLIQRSNFSCDRLAAAAGRLRELHWNPARGLPDFQILRSLRQIQVLDLSGLRLTDDKLSALSAFPFLRELQLDDSLITDPRPLRALRNLRRLSLRRTNIYELSRFEKLPALDVLDLSDSALFDLNGLVPHLRELRIAGAQVEDFEAFMSAQTNTSLRSVIVSAEILDAYPDINCSTMQGNIQISCRGTGT